MRACWQKFKDITGPLTRTIHRKNVKFSIHVMKACRGNGAVAPFILNLGPRLRSVVNLTPWSLYPLPPQWKEPLILIEYEAWWSPIMEKRNI